MKSRFAVLALCLIVALAALSTGYAVWTETLTIGGSMATGDLNVGFANQSALDNESGADYGTCAVAIENAGLDNEKLKVTIDKAYPGYYCDVSFDVVNTGTIPVDLNNIALGAISTPLVVNVLDDVNKDDLAGGASEHGKIRVELPSSVTDSQNTTLTFEASISAEQFNTP